MLKFLARALALLAIFLGAIFYVMFLSDRPANMTDPALLAGDGSTINYCDLPILDGNGKLASQVPKGNTPGCGYDHFPLPILADCKEPLSDGTDDLRGLWMGVEGGHAGHVERIEQCGSRVVVTASGIIHDLGPNSTGGVTSNDTEGSVIFTAGEKEFCPRTSAGIEWQDGVLNFHALGWGPVVVKRYMKNGMLIWEYADGSTTKMKRLCHLPVDHKKPAPRGPRFKLW